MKRLLVIFFSLLLMLSFSACMCISIPKAFLETSETKKTPKATERTVEITQEPNNEKNGFDEKTNRVYQVGAYSFQIPAYYYEREGAGDYLKFSTAKTDADAAIIIGLSPLACTQEEYFAGMDAISDKLTETIDNVRIVSEDTTKIGGFSGKTRYGKGSTGGTPLSFVISHAFDKKSETLITVIFIQKISSPLDYTSDAKKIIRSIKVDPSITATPTATPKPTPKPTSTQKTRTGIRPEFQKAMDEYRAFFKEYCDFIKKYTKSPDASMLMKYLEYMQHYEEAMIALDEISEDDLSPEELKLYLDTTNEIEKMLIDLSLNG